MVLFCISEYCSIKTSLERGIWNRNPLFDFSILREAFFSWFWGTRTTRNHVLQETFTAPLLAYPSFAHFGFFFCTLAFSFAHRLLISSLFFVRDLIRPSATNKSFSSFHNIGLEGIAPILVNGRINVNTYLKKIFALLFHRACVRNSLLKDSSLIRNWFLFLEPLSLTVW